MGQQKRYRRVKCNKSYPRLQGLPYFFSPFFFFCLSRPLLYLYYSTYRIHPSLHEKTKVSSTRLQNHFPYFPTPFPRHNKKQLSTPKKTEKKHHSNKHPATTKIYLLLISSQNYFFFLHHSSKTENDKNKSVEKNSEKHI